MNINNLNKKLRNVKTKQERMGATKPKKELNSYYQPPKKYCQDNDCMAFFFDSAQFLDIL